MKDIFKTEKVKHEGYEPGNYISGTLYDDKTGPVYRTSKHLDKADAEADQLRMVEMTLEMIKNSEATLRLYLEEEKVKERYYKQTVIHTNVKKGVMRDIHFISQVDEAGYFEIPEK